MKIGIIGSARSRSTLLTEIIQLENLNIPCYYEYYVHTKNHPIETLTNVLFNKNEFIVKILGHHLENNDVRLLNLEKYDQLHLVERHDFFNQCCSLQVVYDNKIWLSRNNSSEYDHIKLKKYYLEKRTIEYMAKDISNYLKIKKYLIDKNINYKLYNYDSIVSDKVSENILQDPKLEYQQIINNYDLHDQINECFSKYFSFQTCDYNLNTFLQKITVNIKNMKMIVSGLQENL